MQSAPTATPTLPTATPAAPGSQGVEKTVTLTASRDAPLFVGSPDSNHTGDPNLFVGRTRMGDVRRAMVAFDISGAIPAGSKIKSVKLRMSVDKTHPGGQPVGLHRITAEWAESASWNNRQPGVKWAKGGGDFAATASATTNVSGQLQGLFPQVWDSAGLSADVQGWLDAPATNAGWVLIGAEGLDQSVKRFASREASDVNSRPTLIVTFTAP
ncbi:MAG: DNRLRE domain-containing protein [SAR202 cluster bacterium]|nr:DNRLRE domain-containing protein [SAR202 cluster bacterium]